ncbi:response regulator [Pseudoxanthomonas winnipegensis]|uniref:Response regulator n=1 Tax=Pseudoxanthomonas winnipegensis TaxID=2480810 RepID=A0A4Q8LP06_9GAMM|nr:response regulator [Pseudoxanthomonas winnipegensis]TAA32954.1 response regulator [Pseudoxanthomonas winnipegensis]TBV78564.1 response regulator [Pseudoxanthomonas winnipegensis]
MTQLQERRVLLVDDNELIREMAADVLADEGLLIVQAGDAEQALDQLRTQPAFDLLLTDVRLPGMSGRELADAARALAPALPVIFMTGYAEEALERPDFLGPCMQLLRKPFSLVDLLAMVRGSLPHAEAS